jgi:hypothetical protein
MTIDLLGGYALETMSIPLTMLARDPALNRESRTRRNTVDGRNEE